MIEDAAFFHLRLLNQDECEEQHASNPAHVLPAVGLQPTTDVDALLVRCLQEIGMATLAALDRALFQSDVGIDFVPLLDAKEAEALLGTGLTTSANKPTLSVPLRFTELKRAAEAVLSETIQPQEEVGPISLDIWSIERTLRRQLRRVAIAQFGNKWKKNVLHGDLPDKVLGRARDDTNVMAKSLADLRDPIEWLTLGELLEVIRIKFDGLGQDEIVWSHFTRDVVPIRNRLSHMRFVHKSDWATVIMWRTRVNGLWGS